ncbi:MAG: peroxide stress protein YaaA [Fibrobacterales bacterium]
MIVLLSPAKKMKIKHALTKQYRAPQFLKESEEINEFLLEWNEPHLKKVMAISDALAESTINMIAHWDKKHTAHNSTEALLAFAGHVFESMDPHSFNDSELIYADKTIRILSGFYGMLKPLDLMKHYRFELGYRTPLGESKNPYHYWKERVTKQLSTELSGDKTILNLASDEYSKVIDFENLDATVITPIFLDLKNGTLKTVSVYAKAARGKMARYIVKNKITAPTDLKSYSVDGYNYQPDKSDATKMVFVRE